MANLSIIIPAYNEARHLPNLLQSLGALDPAVEIVVVDNGSTDSTASLARDAGCQVISLPETVYPSVARNRGVEESNFDVLVFLDADIIVTTEWIAALHRLASDNDFLQGNLLTGETYHISLRPSWIERYWFEPLRQRKKTYLNGGNIIISRKAFNKAGGFNPKLETGEDVDFSMRAQAQGIKLIFNPDLVVHHEGFPKDIPNFFRREKWHGKGDFSSARYFKNSRIAQIAALMGACYLALGILVPLALLTDGPLPGALIAIVVCLVVLPSILASILKFKDWGPKHLVLGTLLYFIYFNARLASIFALRRSN